MSLLCYQVYAVDASDIAIQVDLSQPLFFLSVEIVNLLSYFAEIQ
jgi:hypothetical protein